MLCRKDKPACTNRYLIERHIKFLNRDRWNFNIEAFGIWFFDRFWQQLQTRWNFTLCRAISAGKKSVSIPNGMEFYDELDELQAKDCSHFNSQRDGILLRPKRWQQYPNWFVSIPNGMEFYHPCKLQIQLFKLVSIPNGMEFYRDGKEVRFIVEEFQFPTGWNSTLTSESLQGSSAVSIPNGMEFYFIWPRSSSLRSNSFNSQRDGNPAKDFKWKAVKFNAFLLLGNNP